MAASRFSLRAENAFLVLGDLRLTIKMAGY